MKRVLVGFSDPENVRINPLSVRDFKRAMEDFGPGTRLTLTIENFKRTRSLKQNNLLHLYLAHIEQETGESKDRLKEIFKMKWGLKEPMLDKDGNEIVDEKTGECQEIFVSTADYNVEQMTEFINSIRAWFEQFYPGAILPDPEELRNKNIKF